MKGTIGNKELAWMFENCFPNTLDTTVDCGVLEGRPDTYVITGDIHHPARNKVSGQSAMNRPPGLGRLADVPASGERSCSDEQNQRLIANRLASE